LTRRPGDLPEGGDERLETMEQVIPKSLKLPEQLRLLTDSPPELSCFSIPDLTTKAYEIDQLPGTILEAIRTNSGLHISNNSSFRLKHPGVPDGSDSSDGTSYPLTENYTLPVAQATGRVAYQSTWERRRQTCERLGAPRITVEHSGKNNIFFGNF